MYAPVRVRVRVRVWVVTLAVPPPPGRSWQLGVVAAALPSAEEVGGALVDGVQVCMRVFDTRVRVCVCVCV